MDRHFINSNKKRILIIILAAALCFLAFLIVSFREGYMERRSAIDLYMKNSTAVCEIPDINSGFIPQGLAYDPSSDSILITGYMGGGGCSPIYVIDRTTGQAKKILMLTDGGKNFTGHAGGISIFDGIAYVAGSTKGFMYGYSLQDIYNSDNNAGLIPDRVTDLKYEGEKIRVSFTAVDDKFLYAGEFYKAPIFLTHRSHKVEYQGVTQNAYLFGYTPSSDGKSVPACVYSIPDNVQGACFDDGYLFLSQTDKILSSRILAYKLDTFTEAGTKEVLGAEVPLYCLTEENASKITCIPAMSEEIIAVDGQLYILYESASNRYRMGKGKGFENVLSTPLAFFK